MSDSLVLRLEDPAARDALRVGGKGAGLARLRAAGLAVPEARLITVALYRDWIAALPEGCIEKIDATDAARLERLRERLSALPWPTGTVETLRASLSPLLERGAVSVRSSATTEDLAGAACAGQHATVLGVRGFDGVLEALRRCLVSLWDEHAVRYRLADGRAAHDTAMAIVVQRMVAAETAGVAFTTHPITGRSDRVLINAAYGLGETVVAGESEIDQFTVMKEDGVIVERLPGRKRHRLVQGASGVRQIALAPEVGERPCLADEQLEAVAALAVRAEVALGAPQDIEWAFADGALHLLQSRPITRLPERWTRDESAERFPSPVTPLTWDFASAGFHASLRHSFEIIGLPPFEGRWFERFDGYVYGNQSAVELFTADRPIAFATLAELAARRQELTERYRWVRELPLRWEENLDRYLSALDALGRVDLGALDLPALWRHVEAIDRVGQCYFLPNIAISITQGLLHKTLHRLVALAMPERAAETCAALTACCDTKTSEINRELHALHRLADRDPTLRERLIRSDRRALVESGELARFGAFHRAFSRVLAEHGHRELEFDAWHPTWSGQPWVVLEHVRLMLLSERPIDPEARDRELRERQRRAEESLSARLPEELRGFAAELVGLCRDYTALDDLEHYHTTRLSVPFRAALVEIGTRLRGRGVLDEPSDVFFCRRESLAAHLDGGLSARALGEEIASGRAAHLKQSHSVPPHALDADAPHRDATGPGERLHGLPGSPGSATGRVCIVRGSEDFADFEPGAVLVARTTNPAWTPLFYVAGAVVTESGGPLSHGAVTAREIGIPAVVSARDAMRTLEPGRRVRVDGSAGSVVSEDDAMAAA